MALSSRWLWFAGAPLYLLFLPARAVLTVMRWFRQRRFSPSRLSGCRLWLRPESGISATWGLVTRWADCRHKLSLVARAPTDCPTLIHQSEVLGQRPALRFDDGGGLLETPGTVPLVLDGEISIFVVLGPARPLSRPGLERPRRLRSRYLSRGEPMPLPPIRSRAVTLFRRPILRSCGFHDPRAPALDQVIGIELDGHNELLAALDDSKTHASGVRLLGSRPCLVGLVVSGPIATLYINGVAARRFEHNSILAGTFTAKLRIGTGRGTVDRFRGDIGDVLLYDRALDPLECALVASALGDRYRIGRRIRTRTIDRFRRLLRRIRDRLACACYGTPR